MYKVLCTPALNICIYNVRHSCVYTGAKYTVLFTLAVTTAFQICTKQRLGYTMYNDNSHHLRYTELDAPYLQQYIRRSHFLNEYVRTPVFAFRSPRRNVCRLAQTDTV